MKELTREEITSIANYAIGDSVRQLSKQLLAEMDKPSVWTDAPEWANTAWVQWTDKKEHGHGQWREKPYTRELPKSRERQIAEDWFCDAFPSDGEIIFSDKEKEKIISSNEQALLKYKAELEAGR